jgi:hypothetical protein
LMIASVTFMPRVRYWLIRSTRTMAFVTTIPIRGARRSATQH